MLFDQAFIQNLALFFTSFYKASLFSLDDMIWESEHWELGNDRQDILVYFYIAFSYLRIW